MFTDDDFHTNLGARLSSARQQCSQCGDGLPMTRVSSFWIDNLSSSYLQGVGRDRCKGKEFKRGDVTLCTKKQQWKRKNKKWTCHKAPWPPFWLGSARRDVREGVEEGALPCPCCGRTDRTVDTPSHIFEAHTHLQDTHLKDSLNHFDQTLVHLLPATYHHHLMVSNTGAEQGMPQNTNLAFFLHCSKRGGGWNPC